MPGENSTRGLWAQPFRCFTCRIGYFQGFQQIVESPFRSIALAAKKYLKSAHAFQMFCLELGSPILLISGDCFSTVTVYAQVCCSKRFSPDELCEEELWVDRVKQRTLRRCRWSLGIRAFSLSWRGWLEMVSSQLCAYSCNSYPRLLSSNGVEVRSVELL